LPIQGRPALPLLPEATTSHNIEEGHISGRSALSRPIFPLKVDGANIIHPE
jgi:hypothetical protein